ncbi:unnamed protein product [Chrysoparadoxa australica]
MLLVLLLAVVITTPYAFQLSPASALPLLHSASPHSNQDEGAGGGDSFRERYEGKMSPWVLDRLEDLGFESPTSIQAQALPVILEGNDAMIHAQTGSGKTLAYLLPLVCLVDPSRSAIQGLIIVPTRELGIQVANIAKRLAAASGGAGRSRIEVMSVLEGSKNKRQRAWASAEPPHIVIGNPENLCTLIACGSIKCNSVKYVVVDEVDSCILSGKTRSSLNEVLTQHLSPTFWQEAEAPADGSKAPRRMQTRQTVFASATLPQHNHFLKQCVQQQWTLKEPRHVRVPLAGTMPDSLSHGYFLCQEKQRLAALRALVRKSAKSSTSRVLVFTQPSRPLEEMAEVLCSDWDMVKQVEANDVAKEGLAAIGVLREEMSLNQRAQALASFRDGSSPVMLATDLAARGLDIPEVTQVVNFDLPSTVEMYIHRGGRAGRLGRRGEVVTLSTPQEEFVIQRLANAAGVKLKHRG